MQIFNKIQYKDLIEIDKKIINPFSREIYICKIKEEFGNGYTIFYDLGNGIAVYFRNFTPKINLIIAEECDVSGGSLIFNLSSTNIDFSFKNSKFSLDKDRFILGLSTDQFYTEVPIKKWQHILEFAIGMKEELFLEIFSSVENIQNYMNRAYSDGCQYIVQKLPIDAFQLELINYFKDKNKFEDILQSIYLESKTMSLIHHSATKIAQSLNKNLSEEKLTYLNKAKDIIFNEYSTNLSIKNIAYKSAINECYLKKDFKEYFGMTILQMIQERRLEVAKELLALNLTIKEVSFKVGYKNTGHFCKLFLDKFKISPSLYQKQLQNLA